MTAVAFSPFTYFEELKASGVPEQQAKLQAEALAAIDEKITPKKDIEKLVTNSELSAQLSQLKVDLIKWMVGLLGGLASILISIMAIFKFVH